jgi:ATP synthase protein I
MMNEPEPDNLQTLAKQIEQAKGKPTESAQPSSAKPAAASGVGFEFLGSILGATLMGWLIDRSFGTGPWGLVGMIFVGFAAGMYRVWKAMDSQK